jgi:3-oxoacyl-[acyl-carrier protein] reductase
MDLFLKNKVAVVTGATGICKSTALALAAEGCNIAVTYLTEADKKAAEDTVKTAVSSGCEAIMVPLNLLKLKEITYMVDVVMKKFKRIDILVNCAGVCTSVLAENVSEQQWDLDTGVDLKGLFFCCKEVFNAAMKKQNSGNIVNISSVVGVNPVKTNPVYGAAKSGVLSITRYLAIEWGPFNIRVNAISPGWIATELLIAYQKSGKSADPNSVIRSVPLGRFGKPEEIADAVLFLASERSAFTTGANFVVDGGIIAGIRLSSLIDGEIKML